MSAHVLGTPIAELPADSRPAFLISDLHVPVGGGHVVERLDAVLAAAARRGARLFVLGDLFDSYVSRRQVGVGVWRDVAARFAAAVEHGTGIWLLVGNRDFLLGPEFAAASRVHLVVGGLRTRLAGQDTLMLHGDELCQADVPYQRAKRWLRHPWTRTLARHLPLRWALGVAEQARRRSRAVVARGDQSRFLPTAAAVAQAFATGCERLVFGHIHRSAHGKAPGSASRSYWVLPAFDATGAGLWVDDEVVPVRFDGASDPGSPAPVPGPCPFPPGSDGDAPRGPDCGLPAQPEGR